MARFVGPEGMTEAEEKEFRKQYEKAYWIKQDLLEAAEAAAEAARTRVITENRARKSLGKVVGATGRLTRRHNAARNAAARLAAVRRNEAAAPPFFPPPPALIPRRWTELNNAPYPTAPAWGFYPPPRALMPNAPHPSAPPASDAVLRALARTRTRSPSPSRRKWSPRRSRRRANTRKP